MKIEVCEQMLASWLQHIRGCQVVQTNWSPSPLAEISDEDINKAADFVSAIKGRIEQSELDIFKKSTMRQMITQCEIDIVGLRVFDGNVGDLYLVDSAFHEAGLGYHNPVATVLKKILRAVLVAGIVFPSVPANIVFVSPRCSTALKSKLNERIKIVENIVDKFYPDTQIMLLFNEDFAESVYKPLLARIEKLNNDNDLFIRCVKLSQTAATYINGNDSVTSVKDAERTPRGGNKSIVFDTLNSLAENNLLTDELISKLCNAEYAKRVFGLSSFPVLIPVEDFPKSGYQECRYYSSNLLANKGREYKVCSQWIPERMRLFVQWAEEIIK